MSAAGTSDAEFDARYEAYFNRADIDGWEIRKVSSFLLRTRGLNFYFLHNRWIKKKKGQIKYGGMLTNLYFFSLEINLDKYVEHAVRRRQFLFLLTPCTISSFIFNFFYVSCTFFTLDLVLLCLLFALKTRLCIIILLPLILNFTLSVLKQF